MKTLRPMLFFVSLLLVVGMACSLFSANTPTPPPQPPTDQPVQIDEPTSAPEPTEPPVTEAPLPTEPPAPAAQQYFTEEFDNPLSSDWTSQMFYDPQWSDKEKVNVEAKDGFLTWDLNSKAIVYYLFYTAFDYKDVQIEIQADNRGKNNNLVSLLCRYDPKVGWYEFNISNSGVYIIYYAKVLDSGKIQYNRIANGGSNAIKAGLETNNYLVKCQGDELTMNINGAKAISIQDKKYGLRSGGIGLSVTSLNVTPILVEMDWMKVSEP